MLVFPGVSEWERKLENRERLSKNARKNDSVFRRSYLFSSVLGVAKVESQEKRKELHIALFRALNSGFTNETSGRTQFGELISRRCSQSRPGKFINF